MIDIYYYYNYSSETISYYYKRLKNKVNVFYFQYVHTTPQNNVFLNI